MSLEILFRISTIAISLIALIVSFSVAWSNRKTLHVEISDLEVVADGEVGFVNEEGITDTYGPCLIAKIEVVNPSPKDIAFFDLRAFYPDTNMNLPLLTKRTIGTTHRNRIIWRAIKMPTAELSLMEQVLPDMNYGIFKANSFTRFHIIMFPNENASDLYLSFKVAIKAKIKDKFAVTGRKKFKFHGKKYSISNWNENTEPLLPLEK
ncbi:hypothetical protein [Psychrobacillus sp. FSL K6-1415]|uniref:hypothetical protein n=1 Tax=Psychrobacillus sp. FSL K6-1415 TaxID=2921544 RepID=UPI0030FBA359